MIEQTVPDHVAVAVPALDPAMPRWAGELGGEQVAWFSNGVFRSRQLRYPNGTKVELLAPHERDPDDGNFVRRFLQRSGATVHHVTLKVPDIHVAATQAGEAGFDVVDLDDSDPIWKEAFLRPSQVGGVIVQLAQDAETDAAWAARVGSEYREPSPDAARPVGPVVTVTDLDAGADVWRRLGGTTTRHDHHVEVRWDGAPLRVVLVVGGRAGGHSVAVTGDRVLPQDPVLGAAVTPWHDGPAVS